MNISTTPIYNIEPNTDYTFFEDENLRNNPMALSIVIEKLIKALEKSGIIKPFQVMEK